ncbi:hypothetical protein L204_101374 [Cryptococcus depauperatus]
MSQPQYLGPAHPQAPPSFTAIVKDQISNPAYREGNINIARAATIFVLGIVFVRSSLSSALIPRNRKKVKEARYIERFALWVCITTCITCKASRLP